MNIHATESDIFTLAHRRYEDSKYEYRSVNKAFEERHLSLFKIVPPTVGCIINLECPMTIDKIAYVGNKIVLFVTDIKNPVEVK